MAIGLIHVGDQLHVLKDIVLKYHAHHFRYIFSTVLLNANLLIQKTPKTDTRKNLHPF